MTCEYFEDPKGEVGLRSPSNLRSCEQELRSFIPILILGGITFRELTVKKGKGLPVLKKEANVKILKTYILMFGQQGLSKLVAKRLKTSGSQYREKP